MTPPRTKKLFISYRSSDAAKVDKIAKDLSLLKYDDGTPRYTTWQDKHNLPPASPNWWDAIVDAIIDCNVFVFNMSKASLQSEVCQAELDYAHKRNLPIIPVILDGEFDLNPQSGKYDLPENTWELVPDWLRNVQFLFYVGADFYSRFQTAIELFGRNWPRDLYAPRPPDPNNKSMHSSNHVVYAAARDYAERLAFTDAEKHFDMLVRHNDEDYAELAEQWLNVIRHYTELIEIVEYRNPIAVFKRKWTTYQKFFPNDVLAYIFDPRDFHRLFTEILEDERLSEEVTDRIREIEEQELAQKKKREAEIAALLKKQGAEILSTYLAAVHSEMPAPFAWVEIPEKGYSIAKYPVTNAQFAKFIEAGGYKQQKWWTTEGWKHRENEEWTQPRYWTDSKWNEAEKPVVGVSWFEAVAFCQWLSAAGINIMLPTEDQWQYAAQGDDSREYPWGNDWDSMKCKNSVEGGFNSADSTDSVMLYEGKGDSPFGVVDMAGNVWEWCLTDYDNKTNEIYVKANNRAVRGGPWRSSYLPVFRCAYRSYCGPHFRLNHIGFRLSTNYGLPISNKLLPSPHPLPQIAPPMFD